MVECFAKSCGKKAVYELRYNETVGKMKRKVACREHKNMEVIHDPMNIKAKLLDTAP